MLLFEKPMALEMKGSLKKKIRNHEDSPGNAGRVVANRDKEFELLHSRSYRY